MASSSNAIIEQVDSDDDIFDDTIDNETIDSLLKNPSVSSKQQRNLYGEIVQPPPPSEYVDVRDEQRVLKQAPIRAFKPTHHYIDHSTLNYYHYPTNLELRDYQFNIVKNSFYHNILVALPTGLGKTFIASTVILNFHRWFPKSKILFMAPTRPLVAQQIKACCGITGISSSIVATLLDKTKKNRQEIWESKSIFFTTPQVVENDLSTGILDPKSIVLLVIDEAHRSKGNYSYNNVVKHLHRFQNDSFRILSLTATPASTIEGVQEIIDNLSISKIEVRTEESIDIAKYLKRKRIERFSLTNNEEIEYCVDLICNAVDPILKLANERRIYDMRDPSKINAFQVMEATQRLVKNPSLPEGLKWQNYAILQLLSIVGQALRRLTIYGVRSFYSYFNNKYKEFFTKNKKKKSTNKTATSFYFHDDIRKLLNYCENSLKDPKFLGHPKLEVLNDQLIQFYSQGNSSSRCIVFTEFRESALEIVRSLERQNNENIKPHIFIGQAREKEKFDEDAFMSKKSNKKTGRQKKVVDDGEERTSSEDAQIKGMSQKIQKELIQNFKHGKYNILVATSIGEEGLDIGEVDLIICYDSTSSPIKNIQRMGRTGRKRDGKVILLFSSNEEQKFDKAMGGYEYIQKHIMKNNLIDLRQSDRIIPKEYTPIVKKVFIEIPDENLEIVKQEDDDEILRIAAQYMKKPTKGKKESQRTRKKKVEKPFFLPENVNLGFTKAKSLVRKANEEPRDVLDRIFDSSEGEPEEPSKSKNDFIDLSHDSQTDPEDAVNEIENRGVETSKRFAPVVPIDTEPRKKRSLGLKKLKQVDIMDQLKHREGNESAVDTNVPEISAGPSVALSECQQPDVQLGHSSGDEGDVFDDGLDDEFLNLSKGSTQTLVSTTKLPSSTIQSNAETSQSRDQAYKHIFADDEGILNDEEQSRLYTSYYITLDPSEQKTFFNPSEGLQHYVTGTIGHSKNSAKLVAFSGDGISTEEAIKRIEEYKASLHRN